MPRPTDYLVEGYVCHLTHRCHNRDRHLKFVRYRNAYRDWLREGINRHGVSVYGFAVTKNHTHVIAHADDRAAVSDMMHLAAGAVAKQFNLRRGHLGALWEHPFHCTLVETGEHLFNCLCYVDLNMVRAGVVGHPRDWPWCGYHELMGQRKRYRLLDVDRLLELLGGISLREFRRSYEAAIRETLASDELKRQACWTECLAVGSREFIDQAQRQYIYRQGFRLDQVKLGGTSAWTLKEAAGSYNAFSGG